MTQIFGKWAAFTEQEKFRASTVMWEFGHPDKIASVPTTDAAFAAREPHSYVVATARSTDVSDDPEAIKWVKDLTADIQAVHKGKSGVALPMLVNLCDENEPNEVIYGENLPRLRKLKAKYDPSKVWSKGWVIEPDFSKL